jgi:hypothetical protein
LEQFEQHRESQGNRTLVSHAGANTGNKISCKYIHQEKQSTGQTLKYKKKEERWRERTLNMKINYQKRRICSEQQAARTFNQRILQKILEILTRIGQLKETEEKLRKDDEDKCDTPQLIKDQGDVLREEIEKSMTSKTIPLKKIQYETEHF